jgi:DNA-binding MarR family transcriptional regulator
VASRPDPERLAVWRAFQEAHATITTHLAEELEAERDLPLAWYEVMLQLSDAGRKLRMQDLAARMIIPKSSLTRLVDRMEDAGLVHREPCPEDGRGQFAVLTREGRETLRRAVPLHQRGIQREFAAHLTDSDVVALQRVFAKLPGVRAPTGVRAPRSPHADHPTLISTRRAFCRSLLGSAPLAAMVKVARTPAASRAVCTALALSSDSFWLACALPRASATPTSVTLAPAGICDAACRMVAAASGRMDAESESKYTVQSTVPVGNAVVAAAAAGDDDAQFAVDSAEGHDLLWYDASELEEVVDDLIHRYELPPPDERP